MPWSPSLTGGGTPARAQRFAGDRGRGVQRRDTAAAPRPHSSPHHHARSPPNISKRDFCNQGHPTLAVGGDGVGPTSAEEASLHLPSLTPPAPRPPALDGPERGSGQGGGHHGPCSQLLCDRTRSIFRISSAEKLPHCGVTSTFLLSAVGASPWDQGPGGPRRLSPFAWCYSWPRNPGEHSSLL